MRVLMLNYEYPPLVEAGVMRASRWLTAIANMAEIARYIYYLDDIL